MEYTSTFADIGVSLCKFGVFICDLVTLPVFTLIDRPWNHWKRESIIWSKLENENDPKSCYVRQIHHGDEWKREKTQTMDDLFRASAVRHGKKKALGTRQVFGEEEVKTKTGKILKKLVMGEYKWLSYEEIESRVDEISKGLLAIGVTSHRPVVILAETRIEWILTAHACFRINVPIVTLYATLGEEGIAHGINETEVTHIITSSDLMPKLKNILPNVPKVTHIVYMEGLKPLPIGGLPDHVALLSFAELEKAGKTDTNYTFDPPRPDDLAILMYTSGSTGIPKGVMITNRNLLMTINGFFDVIGTSVISSDERYVAYLPVAHALELAAECYMYSLGVPVGFSTPQTLTDFSTAIKQGAQGDLKVLKPTIMASVPLMLDRIRKSILQLAGPEQSFSRKMFDFAVGYKKYWMHRGYRTPMLDKKLMQTYHDFMGGHLKYVMCGGAPISPDTQDFIRCCLDVQVLQGYGMTETAASSTLMDVDDYSVGLVGAPLSNCKLRLVDWEEGQYHVSDKPNPRGEIVVGGDCVTLGYFKNEEQTQASFKQEMGEKWFYTGDIAEVLPNGTFKIIDRKSDLVKLQFGEYVALGKVEAELKTCSLVDNLCVYGSGLHTFLVAVVVPNRPNLMTLAKELKRDDLSFSEMCSDHAIIQSFTHRVREHGTKCRLFGSELPMKLKLCSNEWTPESGFVTAALKIRRKIIYKHFNTDIEEMYNSNVTNGEPKFPSK